MDSLQYAYSHNNGIKELRLWYIHRYVYDAMYKNMNSPPYSLGIFFYSSVVDDK